MSLNRVPLRLIFVLHEFLHEKKRKKVPKDSKIKMINESLKSIIDTSPATNVAC